MKILFIPVVIVFTGWFTHAFTRHDLHHSHSDAASKAICMLYPAEGGKVTGIIFF